MEGSGDFERQNKTTALYPELGNSTASNDTIPMENSTLPMNLTSPSPNKLSEGIPYDTYGMNSTMIDEICSWLDNEGIDYCIDDVDSMEQRCVLTTKDNSNVTADVLLMEGTCNVTRIDTAKKNETQECTELQECFCNFIPFVPKDSYTPWTKKGQTTAIPTTILPTTLSTTFPSNSTPSMPPALTTPEAQNATEPSLQEISCLCKPINATCSCPNLSRRWCNATFVDDSRTTITANCTEDTESKRAFIEYDVPCCSKQDELKNLHEYRNDCTPSTAENAVELTTLVPSDQTGDYSSSTLYAAVDNMEAQGRNSPWNSMGAGALMALPGIITLFLLVSLFIILKKRRKNQRGYELTQ